MDNESTLTIETTGIKRWKNEKREYHRLDGPAIIYKNGSEEWYQDGNFHRLDGPAVILSSGHKEWWENGKLHREDGPAIIYPNGEKAWAINDIEYKTKDSYFNALSEEAKVKCLFSEDFLNG
jgi:hypothetical protein